MGRAIITATAWQRISGYVEGGFSRHEVVGAVSVTDGDGRAVEGLPGSVWSAAGVLVDTTASIDSEIGVKEVVPGVYTFLCDLRFPIERGSVMVLGLTLASTGGDERHGQVVVPVVQVAS